MNKITAAAIALAIIVLSAKFTLNCKPLYYFDINYLNITERTSLNETEIKSSYDYLIYYLNSDSDTEFKLPLLSFSKEGAIHFKEVKDIFKKMNFLLFMLSAVILFGAYKCWRRKDFSYIKMSSWLTVLLSAAASIPFIVNFEVSFEIFHSIFFANDYWLFDPASDPVINLLPAEFFFHCLMLMVLFILLSSLALRLLYNKVKN
ncbi:MAG: TIGR01906 family membrane protein [Clostridiaceae bacterium]